MTAFERGLLMLAVVASSFGTAASALAQSSKGSCVAAFEEGQRRQLQGELSRAIEQFTRCAESSCPARVRDECQGFLETARGALPGLLLAPVDSSNERPLDGVSVSVDGSEGRAFDGRMLRMEPGEHQVAFHRPGYVPIRLHLTMRATDPPRLVPLRFTPAPSAAAVAKVATRSSKAGPTASPGEDLPKPATTLACAPLEDKPPQVVPLPAPSAPRAPAKPEPPSAPAGLGGGRRAAVLAAAVVGGVGAVGFVYFGLTARSADEGLDACTPNCEPTAVDAIKRDYMLANASLGVGVVGALTASVLWLTSPRAERRPQSASARSGWSVSVGPVTTLATRF